MSTPAKPNRELKKDQSRGLPVCSRQTGTDLLLMWRRGSNKLIFPWDKGKILPGLLLEKEWLS